MLKDRILSDAITTCGEWDLIRTLNYKAGSVSRPVQRKIAARGNPRFGERPWPSTVPLVLV